MLRMLRWLLTGALLWGAQATGAEVGTDSPAKIAVSGDTADVRKLYVAVLDFKAEGAQQPLARITKNLLIQELNRVGRFKVFDRSGTLKEISDEFHLEGSDLVERAVAGQLQRLHSVEGFITGELVRYGKEIFIAAQLVKTTSEVNQIASLTLPGNASASDVARVMPDLARQLLGLESAVPVARTPVKATQTTKTVKAKTVKPAGRVRYADEYDEAAPPPKRRQRSPRHERDPVSQTLEALRLLDSVVKRH